MNKKIFGLFALGFVSLILAGCGEVTSNGDEQVALAECLTTRGVIMYGTERCPHCQAQKKLFGNAFSKVNYVDCDKQDNVCTLAGVTGYPTWKFSDGTKLPGTQTLEVLSATAGCDVVEEKQAPAIQTDETPQEDTITISESNSGDREIQENETPSEVSIDAVVVTPTTGE